MKKLLEEAKNEIMQLRSINEILQAKVDTMDLMSRIFNADPGHQRRYASCGLDIMEKLHKAIEEEEAFGSCFTEAELKHAEKLDEVKGEQ